MPSTDSPHKDPVPAGLPIIAPDAVEQDHPELIDNTVPTRGYDLLPMVGLGGSAGGIGALQAFFASMPPDPGLAFVVIMHLAPDHESTLPEVLARFTSMPVVPAKDGEKVKVNSVYVIPPAKFLTVEDGHLKLTELETTGGRRVTVDLFFRALADTHGPNAIAIVLSGADGDGALGIKRIKERGGLTVAQDPEEADHPSMPRSAIETGMVDWVLRVKEMPSRLLVYRQFEKRLKLPSEEPTRPAPGTEQAVIDSEPAFRDVLAYLRNRTGRDFSYYKRATIVRRLSRRMLVNAIEDVPSYLVYLRTHPGEAGALLQDLLISVTNFFRDRDAFAALEAQMSEIFKGKTSNDTVRVWVPACATGEEAYSIAMLLMEYARSMDAPPNIHVFATDLDETAIRMARPGLYPETITADVSEDRLRRFFIKETHGYRVRREIREKVLFAVQDLLKDSPFSRLDLISCRNLLIYLNREAQARALEIFHFSLRSEGLLFLGVSESASEAPSLFKTLDQKYRIYKQTPSARTRIPVLSGPTTLARVLETPENGNPAPRIPQQSLAGFAKLSPAVLHGLVQGEIDRTSWAEIHFKLLERLGPPSLIVNRDNEILHLSESAGRFLTFAGGEPTANLLRVVHPALRVELRTTLYRVTQSKTAVTVSDLPFEAGGIPHLVTITVSPIPELGDELLLITFSERKADSGHEPKANWEPEPAVVQMERELELLRTHLNDTVEQYEGSTEELKASNEELQAINEELRTATEELETSREELQSMNEELSAVNQELKSKVEEVAHANSDLHNLMAATAIATVFVDRDLHIVRFTPPASSIFRLIPTDIGRPLSDLTHLLNYPELLADARSVVANLSTVEREVSDQSGNWYLARVLPYRTLDDHISGVVLTFVDITRRRLAEESLRLSNERLRLMIENAREFAIFSMDMERRITSWNSGGELLLQYRENEILGRSADNLFTEEDRATEAPQTEARLALSEGRAVDERWHQRKDGSRFWGSGFLMVMKDSEGEPCGFVKILHDRTSAKETLEALKKSREELVHALRETELARKEAEAAGKTKDRFLAILSHELRTPLTPVLMAAESLLRRKDLPQRAVDALQMMCRNIEVETHFIDDLLDITKISRGTLDVHRDLIDLHDAVKAAVEITEARFQGKSQKLTVSFDATRSQIRGDIRRLEQTFWNLLINASKFTPERGEISVTSRNDGGFVYVDVQDTGMGLDPNEMPDLFAAFKQGDETVAREHGGLGLGLAIAKATVELLGGTILAASDGKDRGSTFTVKLPLAIQNQRP